MDTKGNDDQQCTAGEAFEDSEPNGIVRFSSEIFINLPFAELIVLINP